MLKNTSKLTEYVLKTNVNKRIFYLSLFGVNFNFPLEKNAEMRVKQLQIGHAGSNSGIENSPKNIIPNE